MSPAAHKTRSVVLAQQLGWQPSSVIKTAFDAIALFADYQSLLTHLQRAEAQAHRTPPAQRPP
jgi:hypothetical protein